MVLQTLLINLFPLYVLIALGYIAGRFLGVNLDSIAKLLIHILMPFVAFGAVAKIEFEPEFLLLPFVVAAISIIIASASYTLSKKAFAGKMPSLVGMASATGNTGYFGLPLIIALLGEQAVGIYLMMNFGVVVSEITLAYYMGARGNHSVIESIKKVLKLPVLYGIIAGLAFNLAGIALPEIFDTYWHHATGAWIILGMMLIGIALGKTRALEFNFRLLGWLGGVKFIIWPFLTYGLALFDQNVLGLFGADVHMMLLVMGIVPLAGNIVAYASDLDVHPEEAAMAVLASTIFALLYIPAVFALLGMY